MKKLHLVLICTLVMLSASAQKQYFVYLQTESGQPFFIRMNQKTTWSSPSGYLIVPKMVDSTYNFSIGFAQNKWPEQYFSIAINKKDHGYLLKNFDDKGWGLFDLQSLDVQMASNTAANNNNTSGDNSVTPFTEILAKAANDPSLKEKTPKAPKEEVKAEVITEPLKDTVANQTVNTSVVSTGNTEAAQPKKSKKKKQKDTETVSKEKPSGDTVPKEKEIVSTENKPAGTETTDTPVITEEKKVATTDEKPVNSVTEVNKEPVTENKTVRREDTITEVKKEEVTVSAQPEKYQASEVKKMSENPTTEGIGLVYVDHYSNGSRDTISLIIPNPNPVVTPVKTQPKEEKKFLDISAEAKTTAEPVKEQDEERPAQIQTQPEEKTLTKKEKKAKREEEKAAANKVVNTREEKTVVPDAEVVTKNEEPVKTVQPSGNTTISNNCTDLATEDEFVRLRKKMAGEKEDKMVAEAQKAFKTRCFSTNQVRTLGRLFETDEERYHFFDAAYKHVFNPEAFGALESEFQDTYYAGRFRAMLRN